MDNELLDIFTDRLQLDIPLIQDHVLYMQTNKEDAVAKLFRIFHNYKASSSYLELNEFHKLVSYGEQILNSLRHSSIEVNEFDIKWLNSSAIQLKTWCDELLNELSLSPADESLFPTISILDNHEKTIEVMHGLTLLYVDKNHKRADAFKAPLSNIFKQVDTSDDLDYVRENVIRNIYDILIINLEDESVDVALELLELRPDMALITAIPNLRTNKRSRLILKGLTYTLPSPIQSKDLKRNLHKLVTSYFSNVYTLVSHEKIYNFIQGLEPLSSSMKNIIKLCDDPDSSIKELIETINKDSISTATILHAASSPIYGVVQTSSLNQAVTAFGKKLVKAICLSDLSHKVGTLNLECYGINEENFKKTSFLRLALLDRWYGKIDPEALNILSASAVLGNLGSILIDQELIASNLEDNFKKKMAKNIAEAEVQLLKTSTAFVTADILEFWGLEDRLVDSIRYSDSPLNADESSIKHLAAINAIVYEVITPLGQIQDKLSENVEYLLNTLKLSEEPLKRAMDELRELI